MRDPACSHGDCRDDQSREDSRDGQDAGRLERCREERLDPGDDGPGRGAPPSPCTGGLRLKVTAAGPTGISWLGLPTSSRFPVFGSGDCLEPEQVTERLRSGVDGVLVGRGVLRNPWILSQAADLAAGRQPHAVSMSERGQFLLDYIELLLTERLREPEGFRHSFESEIPNPESQAVERGARSHHRWVINKVRALGSWYTKGLDNGSHLRTAINSAESVEHLREIVSAFFLASPSLDTPICASS